MTESTPGAFCRSPHPRWFLSFPLPPAKDCTSGKKSKGSHQWTTFLLHPASCIAGCGTHATTSSLTTLLLVTHAHDVHGFGGILELLAVIHSGDGEVPVGEELVVLGILNQILLLGRRVHPAENLVENMEGPLICGLTHCT